MKNKHVTPMRASMKNLQGKKSTFYLTSQNKKEIEIYATQPRHLTSEEYIFISSCNTTALNLVLHVKTCT